MHSYLDKQGRLSTEVTLEPQMEAVDNRLT